MKVWVYPGSFDPITVGHLDIIERASKMCDRLIIGVLQNSTKNYSFSSQERVDLIKKATTHLENVEVEAFSGLLIDFLHLHDVNVIIKGLRAISDFEYELQMSHLNKMLDCDIETIFLASSQDFTYISSSIVKELARHNADISKLVPQAILEDIKLKLYNDIY